MVLAAVLERDYFGTHHEVLHRGGHHGLAGIGLGHDARAEVDRDAYDISVDQVKSSPVSRPARTSTPIARRNW